MSRKLKIALGLPWYAGAHRDVTAQMLTLFGYFGKLEERLCHAARGASLEGLPPLDPYDETGQAEVTPDLVGTEMKFGTADQMGCSLVGMAREKCVDVAMEWGADYLFFFDADMYVPTSAFLNLYRNDVLICGALAFTGREPITPVIYDAEEVFEPDPNRPGEGMTHLDYRPKMDYEREALQRVQAIGGGAMLINAEVFRKVKKPWFYSTAIGEDIYFCLKAGREGVPVHVDTRVKVPHLATFSGWQTEAKFLARMEAERRQAEVA